MGRTLSLATRAKMSEAAKRHGSNSKGKKFSEKARENIRRAARERLIDFACWSCQRPFQARVRTLLCESCRTPQNRRLINRLRDYGLDKQQYDALKDRQGNKCKLCDESFDDDSQVNIDHDHQTGEVRGALCRRCNVAIGWLETFMATTGWLKRAFTYLRTEWPTESTIT